MWWVVVPGNEFGPQLKLFPLTMVTYPSTLPYQRRVGMTSPGESYNLRL